MHLINALSLTPAVNNWLANSRRPRILHVFDHACNLINERREVLSIVTPQIGNGPFNLVIEDDILFSDHLSLYAKRPVSFSTNQLNIGILTIDTADAKLWHPRPDWEVLHARRTDIASLFATTLSQLPFTNYQSPIPSSPISSSPISSFPASNSLISALAIADLPSSLTAAQQLAGLGQGLTPAGDDFIMGAIYAAWIIHPIKIAKSLTTAIAETAAPLTTSLSAAWLRSAGKGEAGILWHEFFEALSHPLSSLQSPVSNLHAKRPASNPHAKRPASNLQLPISKLLSVGQTSGADALAGFFGVITASKNV